MTPQEKIKPVLDDLRKIAGVVNVQSDDWDSHYINVFVALKAGYATFLHGSKPVKFAASIRSIKTAIAKMCDEHNIPFNFLDQPVQQYVYNPNHKFFAGEPKMVKDGYDTDTIKIELNWN